MPRGDETGEGAWNALLGPLRAEPERAAILTDVDGTLAPIAERAEEAAVPAAARETLAALSERFGLVGCVSGRQAEEARRLVGLDGIAYAGNHGLELLLPGDEEARADPSLAGREREAAEFLATVDPEELIAVGLRREDKGARARQVAIEAGHVGVDPHWGRKVLELRPVGGGGKDAAVASLLAGEQLDRAVYAGDDRTDLDAFRRLEELRRDGELAAAVRVGVLSPEGPAELTEEADLTVGGPEGWLAILEWLAE